MQNIPTPCVDVELLIFNYIICNNYLHFTLYMVSMKEEKTNCAIHKIS